MKNIYTVRMTTERDDINHMMTGWYNEETYEDVEAEDENEAYKVCRALHPDLVMIKAKVNEKANKEELREKYEKELAELEKKVEFLRVYLNK